MEISGRIIAALPARSGTSARTGNTWMSQEFVIETHEQYPRKCVQLQSQHQQTQRMTFRSNGQKTKTQKWANLRVYSYLDKQTNSKVRLSVS